MAQDDDEQTATARFGQRVRAARDRATLTLEGLSARSGVSRAMLSNIERGTRSPTIGVASRIAGALGTRLSLLMGEAEPTGDVQLMRQGVEVFRDEETGLERHTLTPVSAGRSVEILYHHLPPGASTGLLPAYPAGTEKYVIGHQGTVAATIAGARHEVAAGEVLFMRADVDHVFANVMPDRSCGYYLVVAHRPAT